VWWQPSVLRLLASPPSHFKVVDVLHLIKVTVAKAVGPFVPGAIAAVDVAALAPAVGPAQAVRDCHFGAACMAARGAPAVGPAPPLGLGALGAAVHFAPRRAAYIEEETVNDVKIRLEQILDVPTTRINTVLPAEPHVLGRAVAAFSRAFSCSLHKKEKKITPS
jgi:hypothetical protein